MCTNDRQGDAVVPNSAYFQKDWNPGHGPLDQSEIAAYQTSAAKMVFKSMDADSNGNLSHREVKNYVSYSIPCVDSVRVLQLGVRSARRVAHYSYVVVAHVFRRIPRSYIGGDGQRC